MAGNVLTALLLLHLTLAQVANANTPLCPSEPVIVHLERGQKATIRYWVGEEVHQEITDLPKLNRRTTTTSSKVPLSTSPYPYTFSSTSNDNNQDVTTQEQQQQSTLASSTSVPEVQTDSITIIERQDITNEITSPSSKLPSETVATNVLTSEQLSTVTSSSTTGSVATTGQTIPLDQTAVPSDFSTLLEQTSDSASSITIKSDIEVQNDAAVEQTTLNSVSSTDNDNIKEVSFAASSIVSIVAPTESVTNIQLVNRETVNDVNSDTTIVESNIETTTENAEITQTTVQKETSNSDTVAIQKATEDITILDTTTELTATESNEKNLISSLSSLLTSLFLPQETTTVKNDEEPSTQNDVAESSTFKELPLSSNEILTSQQPTQQSILDKEKESNDQIANDETVSTTLLQAHSDTDAATFEYVPTVNDLTLSTGFNVREASDLSTVSNEATATETSNEILETSAVTKQQSQAEVTSQTEAENLATDANNKADEDRSTERVSEITSVQNDEVTDAQSVNSEASETSSVPTSPSKISDLSESSISNEIRPSVTPPSSTQKDIIESATSSVPSLEPIDETLMESILHRLLHENSTEDNPIVDEEDDEHEGEVGLEEGRANKEFAETRENEGAEEDDLPLEEENDDEQEEGGLEVGHHEAAGIDSFDIPTPTQEQDLETKPTAEDRDDDVDMVDQELEADKNPAADIVPGIRRGPDPEPPVMDASSIVAEHLLQPARIPHGPRVYYSGRSTREIKPSHPNATTCQWIFKTEPGVPLLLTLKNYSAPETERCTEHHVAVERSNGYEARWCGDTNDTFNHATFARHEIRLRYYTETDDINRLQIPEGFVAEVQALDMNLLRKAVSKVRPLFKSSKT